MIRKTPSHDPPEDARVVGGAAPTGGAPSWQDAAQALTANLALYARWAAWVQEVERAQLDALSACSSALASAASTNLASSDGPEAAATIDALGQTLVSAIRQGQDRCIEAGSALQGDLLQAMRERADALRRALRPALPGGEPRQASLPFDPTDAMTQARKSLDVWLAQWTSMLVPRAASTA